MKRAAQNAGLGRLVEDTYFGEDPLQSFRRLLPSLTAAREAAVEKLEAARRWARSLSGRPSLAAPPASSRSDGVGKKR